MTGRGGLSVDEPEGPRWAAALEILAEGHPVTCMGLGLSFAPDDPREHDVSSVLKVSIQTRYVHRRLSAEAARAELENAQAGLDEIRSRSPAFEKLVRGKSVRYLLIDDYGMGSVELARMDQTGFQYRS